MEEPKEIRGAKGCFRAGSLVQLEDGKTIPIEQLKVGDSILSYKENGELEVAKVTVVHYHEEPEPLLRVKFWKGETFITPNHWVQNQYGSFVEVSSLTVDDAFIDGMGHLRPIISMDSIPAESVWNLTVVPNHTFIIDGIRVHNGGYRERYPVAGAKGGGKGGGGRAPIEDPDTLRSKQYARLIDLVSEGPIEGLATTNPLESIYLDGTPVAEGGQQNFTGITSVLRTGTPTQSSVSGFPAVEVENVVAVEVKKTTPVVRTISNPNADRCRITLGFPRLTYQNNTTGDLHGTTVNLKAEVRPFNSLIWEPAYCTTSSITLTKANTLGSTETDKALGTYAFNKATASPQPHNAVKLSYTWVGDAAYTESSTTVNSGYYSPYWYWYVMPTVTPVPVTYAQIYYRERGTSASWTILHNIELKTEYSKVSETYDEWSGVSYTVTVPTKVVAVATTTLPSVKNYEYYIQKTSGIGTFKFSAASGSYPSGDLVISGKSNSRYQRAYTFDLPKNGSPWDVRITRITDDAVKSNYANSSYWDTYTEIIDAKLNYPNSAYIASTVDSEQFDSIPTRGYLIKGLKVKIPSNYDPITRRYTGVWNGNFITAWTDNPAWCFYDLLTNPRYGLGSYLNTTSLNATKWELYTIARYCDAVDSNGIFVGVDDGTGKKEPRFTCNLYIQTREEAYSVLNSMASIFRGIVYWANGSILPVQDAPKDAVALYNTANVIDGIFNYEGTSLRARHNVALVTWNDPNNLYKQSVEYIEDREGIELSGGSINELEILAVGCTSRGQAHRVGRWALYSERLESETIVFNTGLEGLVARPGDIIKTMDPTRSGSRLAGRILSATSINTFTLDSPVVLLPNTTYNLLYTLSDGSLRTARVVSAAGSRTSISVATGAVLFPVENSVWILSTTDFPEETWRVLTVTEEAQGTQARISAIAHHPKKFDAVEKDLIIEPISYNRSILPEPVSSVKISDSIYLNSNTIYTRLNISWEAAKDAVRYEVKYQYKQPPTVDNPDPIFSNIRTLPQTSGIDADIDTVIDGAIYKVYVYSINSVGQRNSSPSIVEHLVLGKQVPPAKVIGFTKVLEGGKVKLSWTPNTEIDLKGYEIRTTDSNWGTDTGFIYKGIRVEYLANLPLQGTTTNYYIRAFDTTNNYSTSSATTFFAATLVPQVTGLGSEIDADGPTNNNTNPTVTLKWNYVYPQAGLKHYLITNNADATIVNVAGNNYTLPIKWLGSRIFTVRTVDLLDQTSIPVTTTVNITAPNVPGVPYLSLTKPAGDIILTIDWPDTVKGTLPISGYEIRSSDTGWGTAGYRFKGSVSVATINQALQYLGDDVYWFIRAYDINNNYSTSSRAFLMGAPGEPPTVTGFTATPDTSTYKIKLNWNLSTALDVTKYEVRTDTSWGSNTNLVYSGSGTSTLYSPAIGTSSYTFYIKAIDATNIRSATAATAVFTYSAIPAISVANTAFQDTSTTSALLTLSWSAPTTQFGVKNYIVQYGTNTVTTATTSLIVPVNWGVGAPGRDFVFTTVDNNGKTSSTYTRNVQILAPSFTATPTVTAVRALGKVSITVTWPEAVKGSIPIGGYEVHSTNIGTEWGTNTSLMYKGTGTQFTIPDGFSYLGTTLYIKAFDTENNYSAALPIVLAAAGAPANMSGLATSIVGNQLKISWNENAEWDVVAYEIRTDTAWGAATSARLFVGNATSFTFTPAISPDPLTYTIYAKAIDGTRIYSATHVSTTFTYNAISVLNATSVSSSFNTNLLSSAQITLSWPSQTPQFGLKQYTLNYTGLANPIQLLSNTITLPADWTVGTSRSFVLTTVDNNGKASAATTKTVALTGPSFVPATMTPTLTATKLLGDINILVDWVDATPGSLPISHYEARWSTDNSWGTGTGYLYKGAASQFTITKALTSGHMGKTVNIRAYDTANNPSPIIYSVLLQPGPPTNAVSFSDIVVEQNMLKLQWEESLAWDVTHYEVRDADSSWGATGPSQLFNSFGTGTKIAPKAPGTGTSAVATTYYLKAWDAIGTQSSTALSKTFTYNTVTPVTLSAGNITYDLSSLTSPTVTVRWDVPVTQFDIKHYELEKGIGNPTIISNSNIFTTIADWGTSSSTPFSVTVVDIYGKKSSKTSINLTITKPTLSATTPTVSLSKTAGLVAVNMSWPPATRGSLPIGGYEIRTTTSTGAWGSADSYLKYRGQSTSFTLGDGLAALGQTWYLNVYDTQGNFATTPQALALESFGPPDAAGTITSAVNKTTGNIKLSWIPSPSLDTVMYDIREGVNPADWKISSSGRIYMGNVLSADIEFPSGLTLPKTYTYYIRPVDVVGAYATTSSTHSFTYTSVPAVTGLNWTLYDDTNTSARAKIFWTGVSPQFGLQHYKVYDGTNTYYTSDTYIEVPANWVGGRTFQITTVDTNDNISSVVSQAFTLLVPSQVGIITPTIMGLSGVKVSWPANSIVSGNLPIAGYEVRSTDASFGTAGFVYRGFSTEYIIPLSDLVSGTTSVSKTLYVRAFDTDNNYSASSRTITVTPTAVPPVTGGDSDFFLSSSTSAQVTLSWNPSSPEFGLKHYSIYYSDAYGTKTIYTNSQSIVLSADWLGERAFYIKAVDMRGVESTAYILPVTKLAPNPVAANNFSAQVIDNTVMLTWEAPQETTLPISHYIVKSGKVVNGVEPTWASAEYDLGRKDGAFTTVTELANGTYKYFIKTVDTDNVTSAETSRVCEVSEPPDFVFHGLENFIYSGGIATNAVVDKTGQEPEIVLPVHTTETYDEHFSRIRVSAVTVSAGGSGYTVGTVVELSTGTSTYKTRIKVTSVSSGVVTGVVILQPGIYTVAPTGATTLVSGSGSGLTLNVTSGTWASPQAQVDAGYPIFITPSLPTGSYTETIDFETVLASSKITLNYSSSYNTAYPEPSIVTTIAVSPDNTNWTIYEGLSSVFATNFRYVRVTFTVTAEFSSNVVSIKGVSVLLNAKLLNDAGMTYATSTDTLGTVANFNKEFIDVTSIVVSPSGTNALIPVYNFQDAVLSGTYSITSNTMTVNVTGHDLVAGQAVRLSFISGISNVDYGGIYYVNSVVNANSYTVLLTHPNIGTNNLSSYPQGMRVYLFNYNGTRASGSVSWSIKGY